MSPVSSLRTQFPSLSQVTSGLPVTYLDSAATTQKPRAVLAALLGYYERTCANVGRGSYAWAEQATLLVESARARLATWLHAGSASEIVFTRGTTESLNLLAATLFAPTLGPGDEVVVCQSAHHAHFLPWQMRCQATGARLRIAPIAASGEVTVQTLSQTLSAATRIVALPHASNVTGLVAPLHALIPLVRARSPRAQVVVDGAQAVAHLPVDVQALGCDFYCFSGHKLYAPTGVGVLWGRVPALDSLGVWQSGGGMVESISDDEVTWLPVPHRLEAGTPPIAEAIGLGAAVEFLAAADFPAILRHESLLLAQLLAALATVPGLRFVGDVSADAPRVPLVSFVLDGIHPHDVGTALATFGIAVRTGHLCAQPLLRALGHKSVLRASLGLYSQAADITALVAALHEIVRHFRPARPA